MPNQYTGPRPPEDRFWEKVNKDGPIVRPDLGPCWVWSGAKNLQGYGNFKHDSGGKQAHRFAYRLQCGPLADEEDVLHRCDNPPCVRGDHLFKGDAASNADDMVKKGRVGAWTHPESVPRGERQYLAKLTEQQVREIRERKRNGETCKQIAVDYPVSYGAIEQIVAGRNWKHVL